MDDVLYDEMGNVIGSGNAVNYSSGPPTVLQSDYYRAQIEKFQSMLYGLDRAARVAYETASDPSTDAVTYARVNEWLADYESKKLALRAAASGINGAVETANFFGANLPTVTRPATLGLAPFVIPAAILAAAAVLIPWGLRGIEALKQIILERARTADLTPDQKLAYATRQAELQAAQEQASASPLAILAGAGKWVAIAAGVFIAYKIWQSTKDR